MPLKLVSLYKGPNNLNMNVTENRRDKFESKFCKCNRLLPYFGICVNQCSRCTCCSHCILVYCPSTVLRVFPDLDAFDDLSDPFGVPSANAGVFFNQHHGGMRLSWQLKSIVTASGRPVVGNKRLRRRRSSEDA